MKRNLEALKQRQEEEEAHSQAADRAQEAPGQEKWSTERKEATGQLLRLKDRLIDIEKNVSAA